MDTEAIIIAGGECDTNLLRLIEHCSKQGVPVIPLLFGETKSPSFKWDIQEQTLELNGQTLRPYSIFTRFDIFNQMRDGRSESNARATAWYSAIMGYCLAMPTVKCLNSKASNLVGNKPAILTLAKQHGLQVPRTWVSNNSDFIGGLQPTGAYIAKPVEGGDYCRTLDSAIGETHSKKQTFAKPAIVQQVLIQPEVRIYRIGDQSMAFNMKSDSLDYRVAQDAEVTVAHEDFKEETQALFSLMDSLQMNFGAADFKTDQATGKLSFLEVNSSPMFAHFDYVAGGQLSAMILNFLKP
ncbi:hypothetical protein [Cerasicoccus frondis]|uniref:hypothetical protein n=1 Tax=Cerasicoccus frondis TaxID=490090 RepID=UPI00285261E3|nr:hypothetical protein [Cerasicoccus frondis]